MVHIRCHPIFLLVHEGTPLKICPFQVLSMVAKLPIPHALQDVPCAVSYFAAFRPVMIATVQVAREFASVVDHIKISVLLEDYTVLPG